MHAWPRRKNRSSVWLACLAVASVVGSPTLAAIPTGMDPNGVEKQSQSLSSAYSSYEVRIGNTESSRRSSETSTISASTTSSHTSSPPPGNLCDSLPLELPSEQLCDFIAQNCSSNGRINYLHMFYCTSASHSSVPGGRGRWARLRASEAFRTATAMTIIVLWMAFLFSCLGLVASDFFCPNLGTLSGRLGLNESTAGVTLLALGNGSPDVFSTFSAMSTGSGALAIGELMGAASFIVSVVAGSMMLIKPFRVKPWPFLRDVGFFTIAVTLTVTCLIDGHLTRVECFALVGLYVFYAAVVIVGSMLEERRRKQQLCWSQSRVDHYSFQSAEPVGDALLEHSVEYQEVHDEREERAGRDSSQAGLQNAERGQSLVLPTPPVPLTSPEYDPEPGADPAANPFEIWAGEQRMRKKVNISSGRVVPVSVASNSSQLAQLSRKVSPSASPILEPTTRSRLVLSTSKLRNKSIHLPRHSLLGAVEFRDVVRSFAMHGQLTTETGSTDVEAQTRALVMSRDPEQFLPHQPHHRHTFTNQLSASRSEHSAADGAGYSKQADAITVPAEAVSGTSGTSKTTITDFRREFSAPVDAQLTSRALGSGLSLSNIEDPWKEHTDNDGCEPSGVAQTTTQSGSAVSTSLPHFVIPESNKALSMPPPQAPSLGPSICVSDENGQRTRLSSMVWDDDNDNDNDNEYALLPSLRRALFPSLRHWKSKSVLGKVLSVVNAPPLFILALTLPVVDDEAEARANARAVGGGADLGGGIQLKGDENQLYAREREDLPSHETLDGESVLDLTTGLRITLPDASSEGDDPWKVYEATRSAHETRRDLEVPRALRKLPAEERSSLTFGDVSPARKQPQHQSDVWPLPGTDASLVNARSADDEDAKSVSSFDSHSVPRGKTKLILTSSQCLLASPFCAWTWTDFNAWSAIMSIFLGVASCAAVLLGAWRAHRYEGQRCSPSTIAFFRLARCFLGFIVSIAWITNVVDEVVAILQALGLICGLSEAILGITLFAMGNSLADLVADITIARAGYPLMAISACFAGPLLNLLLGVGLSGSYLLSGSSPHSPGGAGSHSGGDGQYHLNISPTLLSSSAGLLIILVGTLIVVPLQDYHLGPKTGWTLIGAFITLMTTNIAVEIWAETRKR